MHITKFFAAFLALAGGFYTSSADVPKVNKAGLQELLNADNLFMTKFYAPWCGHCNALAPEYELAAEELEKDNISMVEVDCTEETDLCNEYNIRGYPTLTVFKNGDVSSQYSGPRRHDALVKYMKKQLQPVVQSVSKDNIDTFTESSEDLAVVGFFDDEKLNATYTDVAESLKDAFAFASSSDKDFAKSLGVPFPGLVAFTKDPAQDSNKIVYKGQWQKGDIGDFLGFSSIPLLDELNQMTFMRYHSSGLPLGIIFYNSTESRDELYNVFQPLAKQYQDTVRFAFLDALRYGAVAKQMNVESNWPAFVITHLDKFLKFPYPNSDLTSKNMAKFVKEYTDGKLQPKIKSQPVPESQGDLTVVVADNYNQVVLDSTKDVLVEFYAPWCGHCKNLAPTYESLAEKYADNKNVVVAKVDATENDLDVSISGFPTIMLFKANDKENPLFYEGDRSLEDMSSFIEKHSSFKSTSEDETEDASETKQTEEDTSKESEKEEEAYNEL
ncbi:protein disulfide isomerase [Schizosaccharomyces octosporus yFS286]|uniref:Protein disulfide-isomerase n=1 Tax=Schizosaccharomyces octosporus (strain yFS286) TaxID=483514 RepID=S9RFA7_SCHOY|nr:protein disulfide isomerase [Schizosaccharomyces octosporus yFS286]EPX72764.1 protein disulfide isomerase [Schizosaccharomyces octosporus yFS286]